jgi:RNA polymerase sigma-70 factor (ECF subfamily)
MQMDLCETLFAENESGNKNKEDIANAYLHAGEAGLEMIINEYSAALLRYCHSILCDYHEAQDAVQTAFIKAYQNRDKFTGGDKDLSNFLYKIAYNSCIDIIRKRKSVLELLKNERVKSSKSANEYEYIPEKLKGALNLLSALDRAVVYGRAVEELTFDELAKIHAKSAALLRKRYERARKKLSKVLEKDYPYYSNYSKKIKKGEIDDE